jgi:hypothetical protein
MVLELPVRVGQHCGDYTNYAKPVAGHQLLVVSDTATIQDCSNSLLDWLTRWFRLVGD